MLAVFSFELTMFKRSTLERCGRFSSVAVAQTRRFLSNSGPKTFALEYTYVENMAEKRLPVRPAHLEFTKPFIANKTLIAGGAYVPELEAGLLLFRGQKEDVEEFAKKDPYVVEGLVAKYQIREWNIAVGSI